MGHDLQQRALAAEQVRAAGDVEEQAIGRIERDQRREAVAPVGDVVQHLQIGCGIGVVDRELRADRARIGQRQSDRQPGPHCGLVDGMQQDRVVIFCDHNAGEIVAHGIRKGRISGRVPSPLAGEG
ncbi:hypothetical protein chiPu_0033187 [Chiloscyllium punctatum]|uniref:Uncharacterized protein n=1 Tax=Chiloscyllium punctatum TaxID=137246 RepID=A0A401U1R6_CHIPU|nr:hypothetical protein [Chiloscyllium punctatum]